MSDMYTIERTISYKGVDYQIIEVLRSETLLVVEKDKFDSGEYPMQTFIIPGQ